MANSCKVLKALLMAMTAKGEPSYVEVQWQGYSPGTGATDPQHARLILSQLGRQPITLHWDDGLECLAKVLEGGIPLEMLRRVTVVHHDDKLVAVDAS